MQSSIGMVCASFRHDCLELRCVAFAWRRLRINSSWILAVGLRMAMCRRPLLLYIAAAVRIHRRSFFSQPFNISLFCKGAPVARDFTLGSTRASSCPGYTRTGAAPTLHQGVHAYQAFQLHLDWRRHNRKNNGHKRKKATLKWQPSALDEISLQFFCDIQKSPSWC